MMSGAGARADRGPAPAGPSRRRIGLRLLLAALLLMALLWQSLAVAWATWRLGGQRAVEGIAEGVGCWNRDGAWLAARFAAQESTAVLTEKSLRRAIPKASTAATKLGSLEVQPFESASERAGHSEWSADVSLFNVRFRNAYIANNEQFEVFDCHATYFPGGCDLGASHREHVRQDIVERCQPRFGGLLRPCREYEKVVAMGSLWGTEFYHFLIMELPRLHTVWELLEKDPDYVVTGFFNKAAANYLQLLGLPLDRFVPGKVQFAKELVVPMASRCGRPHRASLSWLRDRLMAGVRAQHAPLVRRLDKDPRFHILVLRRKPGAVRSVTNAAQVAEAVRLATTNFAKAMNIVVTEFPYDPDFFTQTIPAFYSARIIVAAHGAGLSNMIFAKQPTEVSLIELQPSGLEFLNPAYVTLGKLLNLRDHITIINGPDAQHTGFQVDHVEVRHNVEKILASYEPSLRP